MQKNDVAYFSHVATGASDHSGNAGPLPMYDEYGNPDTTTVLDDGETMATHITWLAQSMMGDCARTDCEFCGDAVGVACEEDGTS